KHRENPRERFAQVRLAQEVTKLVHGENDMKFAESITEYLTGKSPISAIEPAELDVMRKEVASVQAQPGAELAEVLMQSGLASSKTEARRLMQDNAISINGQKTQKEHLEDGD